MKDSNGDDKQYVIEDATLPDGFEFAEGQLIAYTLSGSDIDLVAEGADVTEGYKVFIDENSAEYQIDDISNNLLGLNGKQVLVYKEDGGLKPQTNVRQAELQDDTIYLEVELAGAVTGNVAARANIDVLGIGADGADELDSDDYVFVGANDEEEAVLVVRFINHTEKAAK